MFNTTKSTVDMWNNVHWPRADWINWIEESISEKTIKHYEYKNFSNFKEIGYENFGKVYRANWKKSRSPLVLKSINKETAERIVYGLKVQREKHLYENIIKFYGITIEYQNDNSKKYMLVMEYADSGTLRSYLKANFSSLTWRDKSIIAYQLAYAVSCLHDEDIAHGDLNSNNVLVHQNTIKLADFGVPEKYDSNKYSLMRKDVHSVGVLLWEISSGQPPLKDENLYRIMDNIPEKYIKIYTDCRKNDPPTIHDVVAILEAIMMVASKTFESRDSNSNVQKPISDFAKDFYSSRDSNSNVCESRNSVVNTLQPFSSLESFTKGFSSRDSNSCVRKPMSSFAKDFYSSRDSNSNVCESRNSVVNILQPFSSLESTTKGFSSRDSNSSVRKPTSSFAKDFYSSRDSNSNVCESRNSVINTLQPFSSLESTTKGFSSRDSNRKPMSSFAKDFYSYTSDLDVNMKDLQSHGSISSSNETTNNNYSFNSNANNNQQSTSSYRRVNSITEDVERLIERINNASNYRDSNNNSQSDFWKYLK
ncbi:hypothetical protein RclHR1_00690026 [Rhizophagus clarus]|uniref:Kinase-like domain-containing protein n=1 Tax=Rhizophagus clarus TaxID=94130 RepID=A0A2Z6RU40_9GLOM|nr:hypothetical protein RclHR1_00690026 [Rhizophagus clarus]GES83706.1 kinase-like domain-containing protein [Rhizophagus clarus]